MKCIYIYKLINLLIDLFNIFDSNKISSQKNIFEIKIEKKICIFGRTRKTANGVSLNTIQFSFSRKYI